MVLISEVLPNPKGSDRGAEWVELSNGGSAPVALGGWTLKDASGKALQLRGEVLPNGFLVIGGTDLGLALNNDEETLTLLDPAGDVRDSVSWTAAPEGESFARSGAAFLWTALPTPGEANRVENTMFESRLLLAQEGALLGAGLPGQGGMGAALGLALVAGCTAVFLAQYLFRHLNAESQARTAAR